MSLLYKGWTVDKSRVAYYVFQDKTQTDKVDDIVCEDAVDMLIAELEKRKRGLSIKVDKNDDLLNKAIQFFACYLIVKGGYATQKSGIVSSESIEGMSVSFQRLEDKDISVVNPSKDWYGMGLKFINDYAEINLEAYKGVGILVTKNYRDQVFRGIPDKNRESRRYRTW